MTKAALIPFRQEKICGGLMKAKDFPGGASGKEPGGQYRSQETWVGSLCQEDTLEEGTATHSSILAWRIPWTEKSGRLRYIGLRRIGHNWSDLAPMHSQWEQRSLSLRQQTSKKVAKFVYKVFLTLNSLLPSWFRKGTFHMEDLFPACKRTKEGQVSFLHQPFLK